MAKKKRGFLSKLREGRKRIDVQVPDINLAEVWPISGILSSVGSIGRGIGKLTGKVSESRERRNPLWVRERQYEVRQRQESNENSWRYGSLTEGPREEED